MELTNEEKDIIRVIIYNELEYYEHKEDFDELDDDFVKKLDTILKKLNKE